MDYRSEHKRLGDYITRLKRRNTEGLINNLQGININKYFMPSVANVIGTNLMRYKVVSTNQFACNRMHVGRDKKLPVAISKFSDDIIVSPAYDVFEIVDTNLLLPDYLMMWFSREEFDRNCWFYTDTDVRGKLGWDMFCDMALPVPSIEKQREIIAEYNTVTHRIALNEKLNQKLEETAQTLYKHWFVDFEFPNEDGKPYKSSGGKMIYNEELDKDIPEGWEVKQVKDFCKEMKSGGTPSRAKKSYWEKGTIPWLKTGEVKNNIIISTEEYITEKGLKNSSAKLLPINSVLMSMYGANAGELGFLKAEVCTNQACCAMICNDVDEASFLYYHLVENQEFNHSQAIGGAQQNLSKNYIEEISLLIPKEKFKSWNYFTIVVKQKENLTRENQKLSELAAVLLSKMSK
ncbi:restriction endonuclease subunit S [Flavobacteriaceae bacterium Ap0902]|nr:restriction endonuclease subunit S [Flavobacteriaceae bacterium Ap0902]